VRLDQAQRKLIADKLVQFQEFLRAEQGREWLEDRKKRIDYFEKTLAKDHIDKLTEPEFSQLIGILWASKIFTNKSYLIERILRTADFATLRRELKALLWGEGSIQEKYENFRRKVKGLGPASITEILSFVHPEEFGVWNEKTREAFRILGIEKVPLKYQIDGGEYADLNDVLRAIRDEMKAAGFENPNLVDVGYFLYYIYEEGEARAIEAQPTEDYDFDHDEIVEKVVAIGSGLGFEADTNVQVAKGARVDALWTARIANLGVVKYVFEVQKGGSVDSLILNLQRAKNNPTVQKLVVVANTKTIRTIEQEISSLSEDFKKSISFMKATEVQRAAMLMQELNAIISKLELVKPEF
jgi:hypothetical protein